MTTNTIEPLAWDSRFFGFRVASVTLDRNGADDLDRLFRQLASEKFRLTYFFVPPGENKLNEHIKKMGGVAVDQKTVFSKAAEKHVSFAHQIYEFPGREMDENLQRLVLQAGIYSRFHTDKNFVNREYERLYVEWLRNSLNKTLADRILVAKNGSAIVGMTTLGKKADHADIGLVAVDEIMRGQGIGYDLIRFTDSVAFAMGFKTIQVVTQLQNQGACQLYEKCDFKISHITNVYHYWR
jgi:dTDP-4-amino-4,6-dideoxy-D-galactose acyltransferase